MTGQEFRHLSRPTQDVYRVRRRFHFRFNFSTKANVPADRDSKANIGAAGQPANQSRSFFLPGVDHIQNSARPGIAAVITTIGHFGEPMRHWKTKNSNPVIRYAAGAQHSGSVFIGHNEVITGTPVPDRIYSDRVSDDRDLRKRPGLSFRIDLVDHVVIKRISRYDCVGLYLTQQIGHRAFHLSQHHHI
jgi:hypothetical protein